jgi:hypothetical protein
MKRKRITQKVTLDLSKKKDRKVLSHAFKQKRKQNAETVKSYDDKGRQLTEAEERDKYRQIEVADPSYEEHLNLKVSPCCVARAYNHKGKEVDPSNDHYFPLEKTRDVNYTKPEPPPWPNVNGMFRPKMGWWKTLWAEIKKAWNRNG